MQKGRRRYSMDLRMKVIEFLARGGTQRETAKIFNISLKTVSNWYVRYTREGHCRARINPGLPPRVDPEEIRRYVEKRPNSRCKEIGALFGIARNTVLYWLKKLGFRYKTKTFFCRSQRKGS